MAQELKKYSVVDGCTSEATRKNMIFNLISIEDIYEAYQKNKLNGLIDLLCHNKNSAVQVAKNLSIPKSIDDFLVITFRNLEIVLNHILYKIH